MHKLYPYHYQKIKIKISLLFVIKKKDMVSQTSFFLFSILKIVFKNGSKTHIM